MAKIKNRLLSSFTQDALQLLGQRVREARLARRMTTSELAVRTGISRSLVQRIERGDPACAIGAVFEAAAVCGVPLFETEPQALAASLARQTEKMALLPKAVRKPLVVNDDF